MRIGFRNHIKIGKKGRQAGRQVGRQQEGRAKYACRKGKDEEIIWTRRT